MLEVLLHRSVRITADILIGTTSTRRLKRLRSASYLRGENIQYASRFALLATAPLGLGHDEDGGKDECATQSNVEPVEVAPAHVLGHGGRHHRAQHQTRKQRGQVESDILAAVVEKDDVGYDHGEKSLDGTASQTLKDA